MSKAELTEEERVAMAEFNAFSDEYKEKLRDPNLQGRKLSRCLADLLYYEIGGLDSDLKNLSYKYRNAPEFKYIEVTRLYLDANVEGFIKRATIEDAPALYFLIMNLNLSLNTIPKDGLISQVLSYHVRYKEKIEDKQLRKDYIKLFKRTVNQALFLLERKKKELKFMSDSIRKIAGEKAEENIALIERNILLDALEMAKLLAHICDSQSEYAHYMDLGWFARSHLRHFIESLRAESGELSFLSQGSSAPVTNVVQFKNNKNRKKRKR
ncbi:hypothetical protein [Leptospira ellisii]|nr:hypothetical protein [Leptospira ellisii]